MLMENCGLDKNPVVEKPSTVPRSFNGMEFVRALILALERHLLSTLQDAQPANCGRIGEKDLRQLSKNLFQAIENKAAWLVENGNPQNIANTAWSFATLGIKAPNLFRLIDHNASRQQALRDVNAALRMIIVLSVALSQYSCLCCTAAGSGCSGCPGGTCQVNSWHRHREKQGGSSSPLFRVCSTL